MIETIVKLGQLIQFKPSGQLRFLGGQLLLLQGVIVWQMEGEKQTKKKIM